MVRVSGSIPCVVDHSLLCCRPVCCVVSSGKSGFHTHARDMPFVQKMKSRWMLKMGMSHNKTKQHHFRMQVLF